LIATVLLVEYSQEYYRVQASAATVPELAVISKLLCWHQSRAFNQADLSVRPSFHCDRHKQSRNSSAMMDDESCSVEVKLLAVKTAVRKATEEALKSASSQDALDLKFKSLDTESTENSTHQENENPNVKSSESFALGTDSFRSRFKCY
jgi:hypothetical protein